MQNNSHAVIGLGFGDEGKGMTVHRLSKQLKDCIVIRYSGGQQAGHTVYKDKNTHHVFSNFGSGTFNIAPTYWSKYCTFDPIATMNELAVLKRICDSPKLFIDKDCPVTTPWDALANQSQHKNDKHGTCGVGVGATFEREQNKYSLRAEDLKYGSVLRIKIVLILKYYKVPMNDATQNVMNKFIEACHRVTNRFSIITLDQVKLNYKNLIFEGSQGLLLDQNIGFFPHVTRSNTGTKNILEMGFKPYLHLVTRAYQTRHGNGPMTNEHIPCCIADSEIETNKFNKFQGHFRQSVLDVGLLEYAINKDDYIRNATDSKLIITCVDRLKQFNFTDKKGTFFRCSLGVTEFAQAIGQRLKMRNIETTSSHYQLTNNKLCIKY